MPNVGQKPAGTLAQLLVQQIDSQSPHGRFRQWGKSLPRSRFARGKRAAAPENRGAVGARGHDAVPDRTARTRAAACRRPRAPIPRSRRSGAVCPPAGVEQHHGQAPQRDNVEPSDRQRVIARPALASSQTPTYRNSGRCVVCDNPRVPRRPHAVHRPRTGHDHPRPRRVITPPSSPRRGKETVYVKLRSEKSQLVLRVTVLLTVDDSGGCAGRFRRTAYRSGASPG